MITGSFTTLGISYGQDVGAAALSAKASEIIAALFEPPTSDGVRVRFVSGGENEALVDLQVDPRRERETCVDRLARAFEQPWSEVLVAVPLIGFGTVSAVLRSETNGGALLLDFAESALFPDDYRALDIDALETALKELAIRWYEVTPFERAFADHEAELDVSENTNTAWERRYAIVAWPKEGSGAPLEFGGGSWRVSPLGG